jgi:hypothetical protein
VVPFIGELDVDVEVVMGETIECSIKNWPE